MTLARLWRELCALAFLWAIAAWAAPAHAQDSPHGRDVINNWTEALISGSRLLLLATGALGIIFAAVSLFRAYDSPDERSRVRHLVGALFAGVITITGVIIGVISRILIPT